MSTDPEAWYKALFKKLPNLKRGVVLAEASAFNSGGRADLFFEAKTPQQLILAASQANALKIPYTVLGSGSSVLISDSGFPGLVIKNRTSSLVFLPDSSGAIVDSGVTLSRFLNEATVRDFGGMERFGGIAKTVGGALYASLESFGEPIYNFIDKITLLNFSHHLSSPSLLSVDPEWFEFGYGRNRLRNSMDVNRPVILSVKFKMRHISKEAIFAKMREFIAARERLLPREKRYLGPIFLDPYAGLDLDEEDKKSFSELLSIANFKNRRVGDAALSKRNPNYIVNLKRATSEEAKQLIDEIKSKVKSSSGIELKEEIEYIGPF